jgi:hypothetical protein
VLWEAQSEDTGVSGKEPKKDQPRRITLSSFLPWNAYFQLPSLSEEGFLLQAAGSILSSSVNPFHPGQNQIPIFLCDVVPRK